MSQSKAGDLPVSGWIGLSLDSGFGPRCLPRRGGRRPAPPSLSASPAPDRPEPVPLSACASGGGGAHACRGRRRACVCPHLNRFVGRISDPFRRRARSVFEPPVRLLRSPRHPHRHTFHSAVQPIACPPFVTRSSLVALPTPPDALHHGCRRPHQLGHCPHRHVRFVWDARPEGWGWSVVWVLLCSWPSQCAWQYLLSCFHLQQRWRGLWAHGGGRSGCGFSRCLA